MRMFVAASAALAAIGVMSPAPMALAPYAAAETNDDTFLQAMAYVGIVSDEGPAGLIHLAHVVCNDRANGWSSATAASMVNDANAGLGMNGAGYS
jgi:hypothetical protein